MKHLTTHLALRARLAIASSLCLAAIGATASGQICPVDADFTVDGLCKLQHAGSYVSAGDVDSDGQLDLCVSFGFTFTLDGNGLVMLVDPSAAPGATVVEAYGGLDASLQEEAGEPWAGSGLEWAVPAAFLDVDGDGHDDVVIGEPSYLSGQGRVFVLWGPRTPSGTFPGCGNGLAPGAQPNVAVLTPPGAASGRWFGFSFTTAEMLLPDDTIGTCLVVGEPGDGYSSHKGRALVYRGDTLTTGSSPIYAVSGDEAGDRLGYSVASAGDIVTGDGGAEELLVGAIEARNKATAGKLYGPDVWECSASTECHGFARLYEVDATFHRLASVGTLRDPVSASPVRLGLFGHAVASTRGIESPPRLVVAAPAWSSGAGRRGAVFVFDAAGNLDELIEPGLFAAQPAHYGDSLFGWSLLPGQFSGASGSAPELLIGAPQFTACSTGSATCAAAVCSGPATFDFVGRALLFELGTSATLLETYQGEGSGGRNHLGHGLSSGDFDGSGDPDFVISSLGWSDGSPQEEGRVYVFHR